MTAYIDPTKAKAFIQPGGAGNAWQLLPLESTVGASSGGGVSYESDFAKGKYVGSRQTSNPERIDMQISTRKTTISALRNLSRRNCLFNLANLYGCPEQDFTKFALGTIFVDVGVTSRSDSDDILRGMEQNDPKLLDQLDGTAGVDEEIRPLVHLNISGAVISTYLNKVISIGNPQCAGACGPENSGSLEYIAVGGPVSPATIPRILYTDDGGQTWTQQAMTGIANGDAQSVTVAGNRVIVACDGTTGGIYSAPLEDVKAGTATFVLANGSLATDDVNDILAITPLLVVAVGDTGKIWMSRDGGFSFTAVTSGTTENLLNVASQDENLIWISGDNATFLRFKNLISVSAVTVAGVAGTDDFSALAVPYGRSNEVYVGTNVGEMHRSRNAYEQAPVWEELLFDKPAVSAIDDIQFAGNMGAVMFVVQNDTNNSYGRILADYSGGAMGAWAVSIGTYTSPDNDMIYSLAMGDVNNGVSVGEQGTVAFIGRIQG
jgi:hypothetical protein